MLAFLLACLAGFSCGAALAQLSPAEISTVYAWTDPGSGSSRFSNIAPPWYRRHDQPAPAVRGPRTRVLSDGILVDDTGLQRVERADLVARAAALLRTPVRLLSTSATAE